MGILIIINFHNDIYYAVTIIDGIASLITFKIVPNNIQLHDQEPWEL